MDRFDAMQAFAHTLHLSDTSVTQQIQQLEARLRVKLLNRTTRRVKVTPDGAAYYERVVRLLADMDAAETDLSGAASAPRGRLRVDVPSPVARMIVVPALPAFFARYPDIQLDMGASDRLVDLIGENVDCVLRGGELTDGSLVARRVGELQFGVYAAPSYLANVGTPSHPREMEDARYRIVGFISASTGKVLSTVLRRDGVRIVLQCRHALAIDDGNAYLAAGLAGLGVLWLPTYMAKPHLACGELTPLFEGWHIDPMPVYAFNDIRHSELVVVKQRRAGAGVRRMLVDRHADRHGRHQAADVRRTAKAITLLQRSDRALHRVSRHRLQSRCHSRLSISSVPAVPLLNAM